jgi:hypothetical protein
MEVFMILMAFSGKMRSGKDTAADYIEAKLKSYGMAVTRLAFADTIKRIAEYAQKEAGLPVVKDRELLQYLGANWGRKHDPDVWVKALERKFLEIIEEDDTDAVLVTDLRFQNELEMLNRHGFKVVRTLASEAIRLARGAEPDALYHISETALDQHDAMCDWTCPIRNEGTLEEFQAELDRVIAEEMQVQLARAVTEAMFNLY